MPLRYELDFARTIIAARITIIKIIENAQLHPTHKKSLSFDCRPTQIQEFEICQVNG
jgi:hypothetical protein